MLQALLVCAGGAIGSLGRYLVSTWAARSLGPDFPRGTLIVNTLGSFVLGFIFALPGEKLSSDLRLFLGAGILGGFTTYSSFNTETLALFQQGSAGLAVLNLAATTLGCLAAGVVGVALGRLLAH